MATYSSPFTTRSQYSLVYVVNQGTQDIAGNRTSVSWSLRIDESPEWGSWSGASASGAARVNGSLVLNKSFTYNFNNYNTLSLGSGSIWVPHNSNGTKTVQVIASVGGSTTIGNASITANLGLTTIPRASTAVWASSSGKKYIGSTYKLNLNRASSGFTHTLTYKFGSATGSIGGTVQNDVDWAIPESLINVIPNASGGSGTITTKTYSGSTLIGTTTSTMYLDVPTDAVPDFDTIIHAEGTAGLDDNVGKYVQGITKLSLGIQDAVGYRGSTISSSKITVAGQTINSASGTTGVINQSGNVTVTGTVTDSRGRSKSKSITVNLLPYAPPKFVTAPTVQRSLNTGAPNEQGTYLRVNINASVQSLMNTTERNALRYRVSVKNKNDTNWVVKVDNTTTAVTFNNYVNIGTYSITEAYDVKVEVLDDFSTSVTTISVPVAKIFMHWDASSGVGIGKYREDGELDVAGDIYARGAFYAPAAQIDDSFRMLSTSDVSLTSTAHPFQIGPTDGNNLAMDNNEIMARVNGGTGTLNLNIDGGNVSLGSSSSTINVPGRINGAHYPHAVAAGRHNGGNGFVTVTLPSGRFSQPPIITASVESGAGSSAGTAIRIYNPTNTSFQFATTTANVSIVWQAIQMNSGNAAG